VAEKEWATRLAHKAREILEHAAEEGSLARSVDPERSLAELVQELSAYEVELDLQQAELQSAYDDQRQLLGRYEALWGSLPMAALVVDPVGVVKRANTHAAQLMGFRDARTVEGYLLSRALQVNDRPRVHEAMNRCTEGDRLVLEDVGMVGTRRLTDRSAPVLSAEFHFIALPSSYHLDRHVLLTILDRTEQYAQQRRMQLLETAVEAMDAGFAAFDPGGICLFANAGFVKMSGALREEVVGAPRSRWMPNDAANAGERQDAYVITQRRAQHSRSTDLAPSGEERVRSVQRFPIIDGQNRCLGVGVMDVDITASEAQRRELDLAQAARDLSHDAIVVTDRDNNIVSVNDAFERITGYTEAEVRGQNPRILASGCHDQAFFRRMWEAISEHGQWSGEIQNRRKNGEIYPERLVISCIRDADGEIMNYIAVFADIADHKAAEARIQSLAYYDTLTGLANRKLLIDRLQQTLAGALRDGSTGALAFFDLDHFKQVNDAFGHSSGDELLRQVAKRIGDIIRDTDTASRLGGDEFVILMPGISIEDLEHRLQQLLLDLQRPYRVHGRELSVSVSMGITLYPGDGADPDMLLKNADTAMYAAKDQGRATVRFFNAAMADKLYAQTRIELALRSAVEQDELMLAFQPQFSLQDRSVVGVETLLRWSSAQVGSLSPGQFIPIAESSGAIIEIGDWVLRAACDAAADLQRRGIHAVMAINLSAKQLHDVELEERLERALAESGAEPRLIELEITESLLMEEADWTLALLQRLKAIGFRLAIDDFGTGYSSLAYLNWMPVDTLKIDGSFVQGAAADANRAKVCSSIITLARSLDLTTVAEGVETEAQLAFLERAGCDRVQGFLLARPMFEPDLFALLDRRSAA
jgi:diguanylate cyclase (GGDEF)-like protein/PAS domain S-box-containing protein